MSRYTRQHLLEPLLISAALLLGGAAARAGDEEMMNPYLTFDPETGFFVEDPERAQEMHADVRDVDAERSPESDRTPPVDSGLSAQAITGWIAGLLLLGLAGRFVLRGFKTASPGRAHTQRKR